MGGLRLWSCEGVAAGALDGCALVRLIVILGKGWLCSEADVILVLFFGLSRTCGTLEVGDGVRDGC